MHNFTGQAVNSQQGRQNFTVKLVQRLHPTQQNRLLSNPSVWYNKIFGWRRKHCRLLLRVHVVHCLIRV